MARASATPLDLLDVPVGGHVEPIGGGPVEPMVVTRAVPRGPRGLWQALESAGAAPAPLRRRSVLPELRHEAHLQYLATLA